MMTTYIHYGSDYFYSDRFRPVRNGDREVKPADGTGLWASRENDARGWKSWCVDNHHNLSALKKSFRFILPGASILCLENPDQLVSLPKTCPWEPRKPLEVEEGEIPTMNQLMKWFTPNPCCLNFEKIAEKYDAIELRNSAMFRNCLNTWDCDCILVLKSERIKTI